MAGYKKRITGSGKGKNIGTEGMHERLPAWTGLTGSYGKISSRRDISGPTQTGYKGTKPSVTTKPKTENAARFWLKHIPGARITGIGAISAGSALSTKKKKQKKRVGRTILTEY